MAVAPSEDIKNRFTYHPPNDTKRLRHEHVRELLMNAAADLDAMLPPGREHAVALTKLEEAAFWANASIARSPA